MKFRISVDARSNAGKLVEVEKGVHQYENGRVSITGYIKGRTAGWSGSLGTDVMPADEETRIWIASHEKIDQAAHARWLAEEEAQLLEQQAQRQADTARRRAEQAKDLRIIDKAQRDHAAEVKRGVMLFDGLPQIAKNTGEPGTYWVQAWVLVREAV